MIDDPEQLFDPRDDEAERPRARTRRRGSTEARPFECCGTREQALLLDPDFEEMFG